MSEEDAQDIADEAIDSAAQAVKRVTPFFPLAIELGMTGVAVAITVVGARMTLARFQTSYKMIKGT